MRKIREILRLHFLALRKRAIARSVGCARPTVTEYVERAEKAGLTSWEQVQTLDTDELERRLFPPERRNVQDRALPDWKRIHEELKRPAVTRELLWLEYKKEHPAGYERSQFNALYAAWKRKLSPVMRQEHRAGEKTFVDYCDGLFLTNALTGELTPTQLFVATLGASSYTFAEASLSQQLPDWLESHVHAYEFFGGVSAITVPDNLKSGVRKPGRYEAEVNPSYQELAVHYGTCVIPARVRKPRDKAKVEAAVLVAQRWILARLRNRTFYTIAEMNVAIRPLLAEMNARVMRHFGKSRRELFETLDRPALLPLPPTRYVFAESLVARVNIDYHVVCHGHFYSVPHQLVHSKVELRVTAHTVEILHKNRRIDSHERSFQKGGYTTKKEHMPRAHREYAEWTPSRIIEWTGTIGAATATLVKTMLERKQHPEQAYRAALGIIRLAQKYTAQRVELAATKAIALNSPSYQTVKGILLTHSETVPLRAHQGQADESTFSREAGRGSSYYQ